MGSTAVEDKEKSQYDKDTVRMKIQEYRNKGSHRAQGFFVGQGSIIGFGAFIPVLTILSQGQLLPTLYYQLLVSGLGAVIVIISGLLQLRQNLEGFRIYRRGEILLERERRLYQYSCGVYFGVDEASKWNTYVQNVERIIRETDEGRLARFKLGKGQE
jgi:hypothetical protein